MLENDLNLVRKITWNYIHSHSYIANLEFDDLFSEACISYLESIKLYDPKRGAKSTFLWFCISAHLNRVGRKNQVIYMKEQLLGEPFDTLVSEEPTAEQVILGAERWTRFVSGLSAIGQEIVNLTLDNAPSLPLNKPKQCRGMIADMLHDTGRGWGSVWKGFREVKAGLAEN